VYFRANNYYENIERETYSFFNLFGDLGGVISILFIICNYIVRPTSDHKLDVMFANKLYTSTNSAGRSDLEKGAIRHRIRSVKCGLFFFLIRATIMPFVKCFKIKKCPCLNVGFETLMNDLEDSKFMVDKSLDLVRLIRKWRLTGLTAASSAAPSLLKLLG
jgi:hypothetical protein